MRTPTVMLRNGLYVLLFHYVSKEEKARTIAKSGVMQPCMTDHDSFVYDEALSKLRVNFTDVHPEEGKEVVSENTSIAVSNIKYGLELLVQKTHLEQRIDFEPRCYQIYTEKDVPIVVQRWWNMDRVEKWIKKYGYKIERYFYKQTPQARWVKRPLNA